MNLYFDDSGQECVAKTPLLFGVQLYAIRDEIL